MTGGKPVFLLSSSRSSERHRLWPVPGERRRQNANVLKIRLWLVGAVVGRAVADRAVAGRAALITWAASASVTLAKAAGSNLPVTPKGFGSSGDHFSRFNGI